MERHATNHCSLESGGEENVGEGPRGEENETPNARHYSLRSRKASRLTIHSDSERGEDIVNETEAEDVQSDIQSREEPANHHRKGQDMFSLAHRGVGNNQSGGLRHSSRLAERVELRGTGCFLRQRDDGYQRPFFMDEEENDDGDEGEEYDDHYDEERSLMAFQRYNLRERKRPSPNQPPRRPPPMALTRYNLRPQRGHRIADNVQVPWSIADQLLRKESVQRRQMIPDKALMEATPELQPFESQPDPASLLMDDRSSSAEDEAIIPRDIPTASGNPFARIAGMDEYVRQMKEMVVFPLLYPSMFTRLGITPPRGVLFHGPPGTGKTLMARLLAESCSTATRKVSFFMRNGADCLSKWIGEAERNMKLLFQKARECQPSIIFFDEIDGLAPERSGRADQSHISLVSTLLALMDGLEERGNVVVIGATNRIHAVDPALRRPGRFDREFFFGLPDEPTRRSILSIHTRSWAPSVSDNLLDELAKASAGYSGADLKALCTEAALSAIRRAAPEAYDSSVSSVDGLLQDRQIYVEKIDFLTALKRMSPSTRRQDLSESPAIPPPFGLLFDAQIDYIRNNILDIIGDPIAVDSVDLSGESRWALKGNLLNINCSFISPRYLNRILSAAASSIPGFRIVAVPPDRLIEKDHSVAMTLRTGPFREARSHCPAILVFPDLSSNPHSDEFVDSVIQFAASDLLSTDPILVLSCNLPVNDVGINVDLPMISSSQSNAFLCNVMLREAKSIVTSRLADCKAVSAHLSECSVLPSSETLLVAPHPDLKAFKQSLEILGNKDAIQNAIEKILVLTEDSWYQSLLPDSVPIKTVDGAERLRTNLLRAVRGPNSIEPDLLKSKIEIAFSSMNEK